MQLDLAQFAAVAAIVQIIVTIGGGFYFMGKVTGRLDNQDGRMLQIQIEIKETRALVTASAVHETRLAHIERNVLNIDGDLRQLRAGKGWINDANAKSVDREY